jgi:hypothetical protein
MKDDAYDAWQDTVDVLFRHGCDFNIIPLGATQSSWMMVCESQRGSSDSPSRIQRLEYLLKRNPPNWDIKDKRDRTRLFL